MSVKGGQVEIRISRGARNATARLLTPEIERLIRRQNIETSDINCMKWPVFGLSRYATCRLLVMQRDLMDLIASDPGEWSDETFSASDDGFRIWFIIGSTSMSERTCFNRMHLSRIEPLMVSEFGKENYGEAMYIATFHCDRWAARSNRFDADLSGTVLGQYFSRSWDAASFNDSYQSADRPVASSVISDGVQYKLNQSSYWRLFRTGTDIYDDSSGGSAVEIRGVDTMLQKPLTAMIDEVSQRASVAIAYTPTATTESPGSYRFAVVDISSGAQRMVSFLNEYKADIQAGSLLDIADGTSPSVLSGFASLARIPNVIAQTIRPKRAIVGVKRNMVADGTPPDVFSQSETSSATAGTGQFQSEYLNDPFSRSIPTDAIDRVALAGFPKFGEGGAVHISADNWQQASRDDRRDYSVSTYGTPLSEAENIANDVAGRWAYRYSSGVCDIWFRGWIFPEYTSAWPGGSWIELRLQTDRDGFGFPTTRIHGDIDDPMLGPVADDRQHEVEGSGMAQVWRGEDGRLRVHVGYPFGIPCLIKIIGREIIAAGTKAWRYSAKIVYRKNSDTGATTYKGGLESFSDLDIADPVIVAYNLMELANDSGYAGPGYELPLAQAGFDVIPIGGDRSSGSHDVIVQAMLYMGSKGGENRTIAYFSAANAVDGDCPAPLTQDTILDGGEY